MADTYTVTSKSSYGNRLTNGLKGIVWWFCCIIWAIILLAWNENNYVEQKAALDETKAETIETSVSKIDPELDWKVIYVSWKTSSPMEEALVDPIFRVKTDDLKLYREVEMYQWEEEEHTETEDNLWWGSTTTTTYTYDKVWSSDHIDSSNFAKSEGHTNPARRYDSESFEKEPILLGAYTLTPTYVKSLTKKSPVTLADQADIPEIEGMTGNESMLYIGEDATNPQVWDLRIRFYSVRPGDASVVWEQNWDTIRSHTTSNWRVIALIDESNISMDGLFEQAYSSNTMITWILRFVGIFLLWAWFSMIFGILEAIAKVIPFLGSLVWAATGIVSFCLALVVGLTTIAISWLVVRPIIWASVLAIVVLVIVWLSMYNKSKKVESQPTEVIEA